jgi:predicted dehydrogenase
MTCILRGTEGCNQGDYPDLRYSISNNLGEEKIITFEALEKYFFRFEGRSHHAGEYQNYLEYFVDCIEKGETPFPDMKEGIGTIALLKAMDLSLQKGIPVKVKDVLKEYNL